MAASSSVIPINNVLKFFSNSIQHAQMMVESYSECSVTWNTFNLERVITTLELESREPGLPRDVSQQMLDTAEVVRGIWVLFMDMRHSFFSTMIEALRLYERSLQACKKHHAETPPARNGKKVNLYKTASQKEVDELLSRISQLISAYLQVVKMPREAMQRPSDRAAHKALQVLKMPHTYSQGFRLMCTEDFSCQGSTLARLHTHMRNVTAGYPGEYSGNNYAEVPADKLVGANGQLISADEVRVKEDMQCFNRGNPFKAECRVKQEPIG